MVKKLPSDFDIFSLSMLRNPLCIQTLTNGTPLAPSLCAISFSWCGNCRSMPPPWMSKCSPSSALHIAEHSMCQPGRPGPKRARPLARRRARCPWPTSTARSRADRPCRRARRRARRRAARRSTCPRACRSRETCAPRSSRRRCGAVGEALRLERRDHLEHLRHVLGRARLVRRAARGRARRCPAAAPR